MNRSRVLRGLGIVAGVAFALLVAWHFVRLTDDQQPRTFYDTGSYYQVAERPVSTQLLVYAKPPTVPLVYRAAGRSEPTIERWQRAFALVCWLVLGVVVVRAGRGVAARVVGAIVAGGMALAPYRLGFTSVVLSESIDDSLLALCVALGVALATTPRARLRLPLAAGLAAALVPWIFTRDTNAIAVIAAAVAVAAVWWRGRAGGGMPWLWIAIPIAAAVVDLASARMPPDEPLGFQTGWAPELTSRTAFPAVNNLLIRVLPDEDGHAFVADRGLPVAELAPFEQPPRNDDYVHADPARAGSQRWVAEHGTGVYASWLAHRPLAVVGELVRARGTLVAPDVHRYMPPGWVAPSDEQVVLRVWRGLTANRWLLALLCVVAPFALRHPRRDALAGVALCLVASGALAAVASYYGDALEPERHCYGAAQQIVLGLVLAAVHGVALVEARVRAARGVGGAGGGGGGGGGGGSLARG